MERIVSNLLELFSGKPAGAFPVHVSDVTLHYIALWLFVLGASIFWAFMHLKRNLRIEQTAGDCNRLALRARRILQHSREILFGYDLVAGRFEYLSPSCLSLTGYAAAELEAMGVQEILGYLHPDDRRQVDQLIGELSRNSREREWFGLLEYRFCGRDGLYRSFSDSLHVEYDQAGNPVFISGSIRDVTPLAQLRDSLHLLEKRFQSSQKMAGLGLLASGIAHDFNNLMTVVLGNVELALLECGDSPSEVLDEIKRAALRAAELANQMLVYTGKATVSLESIRLSSVVKEMGLLLDVSISKKVRIQYCMDGAESMIRGEVSQIRQVAMNLITNASEAIGDRPGVVAISIRDTELEPGALGEAFPAGGVAGGRYVRLEVSDTGCGMTPETVQRIFDPLFTTKITGRGLGLASVLNVVQRHNGAIEVSSRPGKGTVFRVYFPAEDLESACGPAGSMQDNAAWRGCGVALVADDEDSIRSVAKAILERFGFRVIVTGDGMETVERFTERAGDISVVLMDLNMPRLNGLEAAQRIRHINPNQPVLFMSGFSREQVMERFGRHSRVDFIKKPFQVDELREGLKRILSDAPTSVCDAG